MPLYRPRVHAELFVANNGEATKTTAISLSVRSCKLVKNDHNHADECRLVVDWYDACLDPRMLSSSLARIYIGNADDDDNWEITDKNLRFTGILTSAKRKEGRDSRQVELSFLDYTALFLRLKNVAPNSLPHYQQSVLQAWHTLLTAFSSTSQYNDDISFLKNDVEFRGLYSPGPVIGSSVTSRFKDKDHRVNVGRGADAWAVWQQTVGMLGLMSYFDNGKLIVATDDAHFGGKTRPNMPVFVTGENIAEIEEERDNHFERKGVGITSFDPESGKVIEAVWPDDANTKKGKPKNPSPDETVNGVDFFQVSGITDIDALKKLAKRVYNERAVQQFTGKITTHEWEIPLEDASTIPVIDLSTGDAIRIILDEFEAGGAKGKKTEAEKRKYLMEIGYDEKVAEIMAARSQEILDLRAEFYVKNVTVEIDNATNNSDGKFDVTIEYWNRIA